MNKARELLEIAGTTTRGDVGRASIGGSNNLWTSYRKCVCPQCGYEVKRDVGGNCEDYQCPHCPGEVLIRKSDVWGAFRSADRE